MAINVNVNGNTAPLEAAVQAAVNRIRRTPIKITVDDKGATQPLGNMRRSADEFSKSMEAANARIIAFGASMAIINGVADAFKGMVKNVVEVEKALADINVVMGLSAQNLERFSDGLFTVAKETGQAFKIAADAATEYARQGLSMEESLKRTKDALILTRLTGMDSANAVKSLTAAMNTYGNQIKDTTELVSKFAAVDVKFAVSAEDFADAIARTGAAARGAGVDIDELIGLVTAAQQQTARGGKVIGNSFKTIFTRIGRTDTLNQLENLGIAVRDVEGNTLGAKRILTDLANTFDNLTEAQKAQIAQTVGGVFQINVLKAVLGDAAKQNGILANATQISAGATDEAITKNEQLRLTMAAMATETGLAIKEVSAKIGEIALAPGMEKILNVVKSVAEGANNLLGDGESAGGKFANGFLKGLGNIITGPGLVVIVAVFGKLFLKAAQYARESLTSLIGVTTEAQKQKAIQTSLVGLFGQNAALSKEMLRTDISRTEKEKIILALLKAQVAEANVLNAVSKQAASTLYRQGFGANLAPRGRSGSGGGRAGGHVPNFAEREQAAKGGYAAGNIREMSMPGQGSVIYNSAEKVKNFAGMKQPAIMPPLSSKAGKNYQQAFGSVHGFDPYAGSGFVPNFNKPKQKISTASGPQLNGINFAHMLTPGGGSSTVRAKPENSIYGVPVKDLPYVRFKKFGIRKDASVKAENKKKDIAEQIEEAVTRNATRQGVQLINSFKLGTGQKANASDVRKKLTSGASGASGAISSVVGALFEAAISTKIRQVTKKGFEQSGGIKGVAQGLGGDFDLRGPLGDGQKNDLKLMFGGSWSSTDLADYKSTDSTGNQKSMAEKILKEKIFRLGGRKTADPALAFVKERMPQLGDKNKRVLGPRRGPSGRGPKLSGEGYVPNYAAATLARFGLGVKSKFQMAEMIKNSPFKHQLTRYGHWKNFPPDVKKRFNKYLLSQGLTNKTLQSYGFLSKNSKSIAGGLGDFLSADGHVPNFANPLADAVNREKGAGVPVSQIRVGSHQALMNKGNPLGLGVTNTTDEPNGLRDVFGANGYVPNYAPTPLTYSDIGSGRSGGSSAAQAKMEENAKQYNKSLQRLIKLFERKKLSHEQLIKGSNNLNQKYRVNASASSKVSKELNSMQGSISKAKAGLSGMNSKFAGSKMGKAMGSTAGQMGLMMGLPMAAGFVEENVGGTLGSAIGGSLQGAGSGAAMGMMFGPLGTAIGATAGAFYGLISGIEKAKDSQALLVAEQNIARQKIKDDKVAASFNAMIGEIVKNTSKINFDAQANISEQVSVFTKLGKAGSGIFGMKNEEAADKLTDSLRAIIATPDSKGGKAANLLGLEVEDLFDQNAVQFTRENEGEFFDFRDSILQIDKVVEGILNRTITEKGVGAEDDDPSNIAINSLNKSREDLREALLVQIRQMEGGQAIIDDFYKTQEVATSFAKEFQGFYKESPKTLAESVAVLGNLSVEDLQDVNRKGAAESVVKSFIEKGLDDDSEMEVEIKDKIETVNKRQLLAAIEAAKEGQELAKLLQSIGLSTKKILTTSKAQQQAVILQLNAQKAMLTAQQATVSAQMDIKSTYMDLANQTKMQSAFMGKFISEEQKVKNQYLLSINKAKEAFVLGEEKAKSDMKVGIIGDISKSQNKGLEQSLKRELFFGGEKVSRKSLKSVSTVDLTGELSKKSNEDLLAILRKIGASEDEANKIVQNRLLLYNGSIDKLQKQNGLSLQQAANEKSINMVLAQRKTLLDDMTDRIEEFNRKAAFNAERGAIEKAISDAQIKGTGYISADAQLARDRADMNNRIIPDMQAQGKGKSLEALKALGVGFNEDEQDKIMQMVGDDLDITSIVKEQRKREFKELGGRNKMTELESDLYVAGDKEFLDKDSATYQDDLNKILQMESELAKLKELDAQRTKLSEDLTDEIDEANTSLKRQNILNEKNVQKVKEEMLARERMRERMTGPGAAGFGFEDGMDEMRDRIKTMDYELTKSIPGKLADGLATAMTEAANGAKSIGDALEDAALNFLSYMQQAMMQKLAMQAVGALGFSQGGGVRKYSSGGNVPAMVTNGEYVMGREAVKKYGGGFMHSLNARGKIPNYSMGGDTMQEYGMGKIPYMSRGGEPGSALAANFGGGESFVSGRNYQSRAMSGFFYSGQAGNVGLQEDTEEFKSILQKREEERRRREMERQAKKAKRRKILGMVGSIAASYVLGSVFSEGGFGAPGSPGNSWQGSTNLAPGSAGEGFAFAHQGGPIKKYAAGGMIHGKSGIDQIPAMLSEGEYVIKASSARQMGKPMLDRINAGKFYEGGSVSPEAQKEESSVSGGQTNNISINIKMDGSGNKQESSENQQDSGGDVKKQNQGELGKKIKDAVVGVIIEEKRPGGLLSEVQ